MQVRKNYIFKISDVTLFYILTKFVFSAETKIKLKIRQYLFQLISEWIYPKPVSTLSQQGFNRYNFAPILDSVK
jgi:hypothetical protein